MYSQWKEYELGKLFKVKHGYAFKGEYFSDSGDFLLLTPGNFKPEGGLKYQGDKEKYYVGKFPEEYIVKEGDMLIAMTDLTQDARILGSTLFVPESGYLLHNQRLGLIQNLKEGEVDKYYLYCILNSPLFREQLKATATGATVKHTAPGRIYSSKIRFPKLDLQKKISSVIRNYDELIENNTKRIAILEQMAEQIYKEWFVRMRFPGHENTKFVKGIPEGWEVKLLNDLCSFNKLSISNKNRPERIKYVDISSVTTNSINNYEEMEFNAAPSRARRIVKHGDIIWSSVRPINRAYSLIINPPENLVVSTGFIVITPKLLPTEFIYYFTTSDAFVEHIASVAKGAAYPAASVDDFKKMTVLKPSQEIVEKYISIVRPIFSEVNILKSKTTVLQASRNLLLPRLISGKLSVEHLTSKLQETA